MEIVQWPSGNFGFPRGAHGRKGEAAIAICDHIMQGWRPGYHAYLADPSRNSATFSVYQDGHVEQHVAIADAAWCNGPMAKPDLSVPFIKRCFEQKVNPNLVTVSIEHEGLTGKPWPEAQVQASIELHRYILSKCPGILPDRSHIVGHYQIDSVNKAQCPGTGFPWARLMAALAPAPPVVDGTSSPLDPILERTGEGLRAYYLAHVAEFGHPTAQWFDPSGNETLVTASTPAHPTGQYHTARKALAWKIKTYCWCH